MLAAIAYLSLLFGTLALYSSKDNVIIGTSGNFKKVVLNTEHPVIVEFFAPWCGHCKQLVVFFNQGPRIYQSGKEIRGDRKGCSDRLR